MKSISSISYKNNAITLFIAATTHLSVSLKQKILFQETLDDLHTFALLVDLKLFYISQLPYVKYRNKSIRISVRMECT